MATLTRYERTTCANLYHKLHFSVEHLATTKGTVKARLGNVMVSYLIPLLIRDETTKIAKLIDEAVRLATTNKNTKERQSYAETLATNDEATDQTIAQKIFEAYLLASQAYHSAEVDRR